MAGTKEGAAKTRARNLENNPHYYYELGSKGGSAPHSEPRGFAAMTKEKLREVSKKGGKNGRKHKN